MQANPFPVVERLCSALADNSGVQDSAAPELRHMLMVGPAPVTDFQNANSVVIREVNRARNEVIRWRQKVPAILLSPLTTQQSYGVLVDRGLDKGRPSISGAPR